MKRQGRATASVRRTAGSAVLPRSTARPCPAGPSLGVLWHDAGPRRQYRTDEAMRQAARQRSARPAKASATGGDVREAGLTIRVNLGSSGYIGPGKIELMERISRHGSISAAGKDMKMSYRRAWLL